MELKRIETLDDDQVRQLHALYENEWWTRGRELDDIRYMLSRAQVVVAFAEAETGRLAAFARVVTDYVYKALVLDVIVAPAHRRGGLGRQLMEAVLSHPELQRVKHFELYCLPELVPFYERWGFTADLGVLKFMRLARPLYT